MDDHIYLNVGGTIFETTKSTLVLCPYFRKLIEFPDFNSTREKPYFIDRCPKIFRHVLNLLRNINYDYPEKYIDELEFYGFVNDMKNDMKNDRYFSIVNDNYNSYYSNNNHMPIIETINFDTVEWSFNFSKCCIIRNISLLLPKFFLNKLELFTITYKCEKIYNNPDITFNLGIISKICKIPTYDDYILIDLQKLVFINLIICYGKYNIYYSNEYDLNITLACKFEKKENFKSALKFTLYNENTSKIATKSYEHSIKYIEKNPANDCIFFKSYNHLDYALYSYEINGDFTLPKGNICFIFFKIEQDFDYLKFDHNNQNNDNNDNNDKNLKISNFDAKFMYNNYDNQYLSDDYFNDDYYFINFSSTKIPLKNKYALQLPKYYRNNSNKNRNCKIKFYKDDKYIHIEGIIWIYCQIQIYQYNRCLHYKCISVNV
ncbi:BTB/POZ domain protein [Hokovirus HKV1]|uniref:BTB/POZ domain protein n=1 Tax=Hokovirus HKV1 TaxID=1977638 RepID=A0A1V0SHC2_9VIRU|nr:BTB/POZ domain protein [Hokovirus HKV1]